MRAKIADKTASKPRLGHGSTLILDFLQVVEKARSIHATPTSDDGSLQTILANHKNGDTISQHCATVQLYHRQKEK